MDIIVVATFWWLISLYEINYQISIMTSLRKIEWMSIVTMAFCVFNAVAFTYVGFCGPNSKLFLTLAVAWGIFSMVCGVILITDRKHRREPSYWGVVGMLAFGLLNFLYCLFKAGYLF